MKLRKIQITSSADLSISFKFMEKLYSWVDLPSFTSVFVEYNSYFLVFLHINHRNACRFASDFIVINKIKILAFFGWSICTICSSLLLVMQSNDGNFMELIEPFVLAFWSFAFIFLLCNFGENVTSQFTAIDNAISEFDWNFFPHDVQRFLPTIMISTQKPVIFQGIFGNVVCTRAAFKTVSDSQEIQTNVGLFRSIILKVEKSLFHNWRFLVNDQWNNFFRWNRKLSLKQTECWEINL